MNVSAWLDSRGRCNGRRAAGRSATGRRTTKSTSSFTVPGYAKRHGAQPDVDLEKDFTERTSLRVNFGVDAISAASDSCARCHRDGVNSHRRVGGLSVTRSSRTSSSRSAARTAGELLPCDDGADVGVARSRRTATHGRRRLYVFAEPAHASPDTADREPVPERRVRLADPDALEADDRAGRLRAGRSSATKQPYLRPVNGVMILGHVPDLRTARR